MSITARAVLVLAVVIGLRGISATPLQPTFSSCLNEYPPLAASEAQFVFSQVYAEVLDGVEASKLGLAGNGNSVLRVDLLGSVGAELAGYDNDTNKLGQSPLRPVHEGTKLTNSDALHRDSYG